MTEVLARPQGRRWATRAALVATAATAVLATVATSASAATTTDGFNPGPDRLVDTRIDMNDRPAGKVDGFLQTTLPTSVPDGDSALLSVTVVDPTTSGFVKVYSDATADAPPATSDVNFIAGPTVAQAVLVPATAGANGRIDFQIGGNSAPINLVVDVIGSFPSASYTPLATAQRVYDTRSPGIGTSTPGKRSNGVFAVNVNLPSAGDNAVPDDAQLVALTVTQVGGTGNGFVSVLSSSTPGTTSSLNFTSSSINSNLVFAKPDAGRVYLQVGGGSATDLIVDVKGYGESKAVSAQSPVRTLDTRTQAGGGLLGPGIHAITLPSSAPAGASFAVLNVTSTESTVGGYVSSYQAQTGELQTSNLNFAAGQTVAGFVLAPIVNGKAQVFIGVGTTKLLADVEGYVVNATTNN